MTIDDEDRATENKLIIAQYLRASYDFRHFDQLIWQLPNISITITSVIFGVSFGFIRNNYIIMGIVMILGSFFNCALLTVLSKFRLMQDVRARWMEHIEGNYEIDPIPVSTEQAEKFLKEQNHNHVLPPFFRKKRAIKALFSLVFIMFITMLVFGFYYIALGLKIF